VRRLSYLTAAVLAVLLIAHPVAAQSRATTAELGGQVTDPQGGALPGATATVHNGDTGYTRSAVTNAEGFYTLTLLPPGTYELTVELSGFSSAKRTVILNVGSTLTVNVPLQVGGVQETVSVHAASPIVETSATVRTTTVDSLAISNLPINGRRFQDFITGTPTVQVDTQRGQLSFAGQRGINSNINIDGVDFNQPFFGGIRGGERSNNAFTVPQESIQEFQVVAAGYTAEFGRSTGGLVNAVTKSGTNLLRGSAFYVNRNRDWAELNAFGQNAAPTQQQFGGSVGGPITKDKIFFFGAYEQQLFKNTRQVLFDKLGTISAPAGASEAFNYYKSLETPFEATNDAWTGLGRVDFQLRGANRLSFRYSFSKNRALNANATGNALDPNTVSALSNNGTERDRTHVVVGQYTSALGTNLLLEARGQFSREDRPRVANDLRPNVTTTIGRFGTVNFLPTTQYDTRGQGAANLTWITGAHSVKVGTEYNHVYANQSFGFNQFGLFNISGTNVATHLDILSVGGTIPNRFDSTDVTYLRQLGNLLADYSTNELAFYGQDAWKLAPNFTVNYGLRWEGAFNPTPVANNDFMLTALASFTSPVDGRTVDPTQIPDDLEQWGPRVGFAWDVANDGKTVVRGYSGLYYARTPALIWASPINNFRVPPGDLSLQLPLGVPAGNPNNTVYKQLLLIGIDLNTTPLDQLPVLTVDQVTSIAGKLGLSLNPYRGAQPIAVDKDFKNPRATQVGAGVEREIIEGLSVGADFTYVKTERLERNRELNLPVPVIRPTDPAQRPYFGLTTGTPRPLSALGSVQVRESTAHSDYKALSLTSRLRQAWGELTANYVLSKSMSDDDNERDSGGPQYENTFDLGPEWGPARLDRRHIFNGFGVFHLPWNVDVSSNFRFLSGRPIDVTFGSDVNGDRGGPDRPYSAPGVPFTRNGYGNEPFKEVNFRAQYKYSFAGDNTVMFTFEVFNVFNWDNIELAGTTVTNYCAAPVPADCGFGSPTNPNFLQLYDQVPTSSRFGQLLLNNSPGNPRQIQLGIRFQF
jgi:Carboxypeptidase regulatory-like domain